MKTNLSDHIPVVYVVGTDLDGPVKIGRTNQIAPRLAALQLGNPLPLQFFALRFAAAPINGTMRRVSLRQAFLTGSQELERAVHKKLGQIGIRLMGEWFDLSAADAVRAIDKVGESMNIRPVGLEHLLNADLSGRADASMDRTLTFLRHEALALNKFVVTQNKGG